MTKEATVRQADLIRMAKVAKEFNVVVERELNGIIVRVAPYAKADDKQEAQQNRSTFQRHKPPTSPIEPELNRYEYAVIKALAALGPNVKQLSRKIKSLGVATEEKLLSRGYIAILKADSGKYRDEKVSLTDKGSRDWETHLKHIRNYPYL
ncbi:MULTISPECIES: hypothetical protein [unclassified Rhizobium]|uniref:hypothetical protein n=1 Tax=unclassified Rhizobium TaxID=2613769 RepID=UPI0028897CEC|nr:MULTISPECIES: hypothetical protein [unclassified Rhizobium]